MRTLAALYFLLQISGPVLGLYIDPLVLQDIRAERAAAQLEKTNSSNGFSEDRYSQIASSPLHFQASADHSDEDAAFQKRGKVDNFMVRFSTAGARKAMRVAKHNPKTATVLIGAVGAKTVYELMHHDDDDPKRKTVVYVNSPTRPSVKRRVPYVDDDHDVGNTDDDNEAATLVKRTGPVDSFLGKTIKKGATGTKNFAKKNPWTATVVGGTLLTAGAVKVYNMVNGDDHTQVINLADAPAHKRELDTEPTVLQRGDNADREVGLSKRGISKAAYNTKIFAKSNKWLMADAVLAIAGVGAEVKHHYSKKHEKVEEKKKKADEEAKSGKKTVVKRALPSDDVVSEKRKRSLGHTEKQVPDTALEKRGPPQSYSQRAKAFAKTKKGKMIIGGMVVKSGITLGILYHLSHKNQKQSGLKDAGHIDQATPSSAKLISTMQKPFTPPQVSTLVKQDGDL